MGSLKEDSRAEERKPITSFIKVTFHGDQSIDPVDILRSKEGYQSFIRDRRAIPPKEKR